MDILYSLSLCFGISATIRTHQGIEFLTQAVFFLAQILFYDKAGKITVKWVNTIAMHICEDFFMSRVLKIRQKDNNNKIK